ncbi:MAG: hypothetical protein NVS2B12_37790 [Ktedonobacteraceae bacterium]
MVFAQKTILMIEDQPIYSKIIIHTLSQYPQYRIIHRPDGAQVLSVIREHQPQLLMLDYNLPGMNGIELYDLVHATPGMAHIPAVMVSANLPRAEIALRKIPGLRKPCRTSDLIKVIESVLTQTIFS